MKLSNIWTTRKILANSHRMKDYPADYRVFLSPKLTHEERIIEKIALRSVAISMKKEQTGRLSEIVT